MPPHLVTIHFSHFCDKARWALDHAGVAFTEDAHLPGFHRVKTRRLGARLTPILVTDEGLLTESTDIVRYADERAPASRKLYPTDATTRAEVDAFVAELDAGLGPATRLLAYHHLLPRPRALVAMVGGGMPWAPRVAFRWMLPALERPIRRLLRIDPASAERSVERVRATLAHVGSRLADGRPYLFGDRLGAADITFAALLAPVLAPPGHPHYTSDVDALAPPELLALISDVRATEAGRFATRLYRDERRAGC